MSKLKVFVGFVPWIVFTLVASRLGPGAIGEAGLLAFLVAGGLLVRSTVRGESPKLLEVTGAVVFLGFGAAAFADPALDGFLASYGRALAALILAVVIFALLPVMPFTEQYARESVPREYWHSPVFRSVNRRISAAWGLAIAAMTICHALAGVLVPPGVPQGVDRPVELALNWVLPGLLIWGATRFTQRTADAAHDRAQAHRPAHEAGAPAARR